MPVFTVLAATSLKTGRLVRATVALAAMRCGPASPAARLWKGRWRLLKVARGSP